MSARDEALAFLLGLAREVETAIDEDRLPELSIPARTLANVLYDPARGSFELGPRRLHRGLDVGSVLAFAQTLRLAALARELAAEGDFATKREAYYVSKNWGDCRFHEQPESDAILADLEAMASLVGLTREALGFLPEAHGGSVAGRLVVIDETPGEAPVRVDCRALGKGAYAAPRSLEHVRFESDAAFVLAIETGGMFQRLHQHRFWDRMPCILVELGGVPTRATRRFLRRLADDLGLPIHCFTDCDPYGFANIYRTLKVGSASSLHAGSAYAVPTARFLGVTPDDIRDYRLEDATHPLDELDRKRAHDALAHDPFFQAHPAWSEAIERLVAMGVRAEQQALAKWGLNYVIEEYLPRKLAAPERFLP